ncbi:MAG: efflux RND transporter periplasmic adaptor subunit [Phenylobacterium sp.]|uniref:efflux RND transporter periplasmic adaptor subunit n=1 Tax=Phenylobacterium sp. TaxID=1871053 RepID=UPI00391D5C9F
MRLKSSHLFALVIVGLVGLYFIVGALTGGGDHAPATAKAADDTATVQAKVSPEVSREYTVVIRGRTEAARSVVVRSETSGVVAQTPAVEGSVVRKGAVLCRLAVDARQATLDQARAALRSRELTRQATMELAKKGYRSQTQVLQDQANLDAAAAAVRQAEIALEQVNLRAPFDGVFDRREAEIGTYLSPGQACGTVIELDPILVVGDLPETEAGRFAIGAPATATLVSGEKVSGKVRYVARDADAQTRTYRVEVLASNPRLAARSGLSAEVRIGAGVGPAHLVPVSSLVLDAAGRQGVRFVKADGTVGFSPVSVMEETSEGVWVRGLRGAVKIITVGQSYVGEGQKVRVASAR